MKTVHHVAQRDSACDLWVAFHGQHEAVMMGASVEEADFHSLGEVVHCNRQVVDQERLLSSHLNDLFQHHVGQLVQ